MVKDVRCPNCNSKKTVVNNKQVTFECCGKRHSIDDNLLSVKTRYDPKPSKKNSAQKSASHEASTSSTFESTGASSLSQEGTPGTTEKIDDKDENEPSLFVDHNTKEVEEDLIDQQTFRCECGKFLSQEDYKEAQGVCPECGGEWV